MSEDTKKSSTLLNSRTWVGTKKISLEPFQNFFPSWFRNFGLAFWIELLIAQPIARFAIKEINAIHAR
ncbi:hypothetical protein E0Y62_07970 [Cytobacillus praedii]|uniref:Uncharacterized protein n=1 Tax=Cytobacillus praedii TaxID=1742358 RepID=A0A4R1B3X2_9BACI|nr:hypothetical protein E0Y62_07970 [Cytobacillus praedii]